jgi:hypothetical protein
MLGTIVNTATILIGSAFGATLRTGMKERYRKILFDGLGLACIMLGVNATVSNMPKSEFPVLFILSLAVGGLIGQWWDPAGRLERWESRRKARKHINPDDPRPSLIEGLTTGILLYCIGTFAIVGPVLSALSPTQGFEFSEPGNTYLYTNATLDLVTSAVLAATYGWGMMLAAPVLFLWQTMFYVIAYVFRDAMPDPMRCEISIVGGVLILCSGLNILKIRDIKTINLLPSLLVPVVYYLIKGLF